MAPLPTCLTKAGLTFELDVDPNYCKRQGFKDLTSCYDAAPLTTPDGCLNFVERPDPPKPQPLNKNDANRIADAAVDAYKRVLENTNTLLTSQLQVQLDEFTVDIGRYNSVVNTRADAVLRRLETDIADKVELAQDAAVTVINDALDNSKAINKQVIDALPDAFDALDNLALTASETLVDTVGTAIDQLDSVTQTALTGVETTLTDINNQTILNYNTLGEATNRILDTTGIGVTTIIDRIDLKTLAALDAVNDRSIETDAKLDRNMAGLFNGYNQQIDGYGNKLSAFVTDSTGTVSTLIGSLNQTIQDIFEKDIGGAKALADVVIDKVADLPATVRSLTSALTDSAEQNILDPLERVGERIATALGDQIASAIGADKNDYKALLKNIVGADNDNDGIISRTIDAMLPDDGLNIGLRALMFSIATPLIAWSTLQGIAAVNSQRVMHEYSFSNPSQLLTPADLVSALKRNNITQDKFTDDLKRLGHYSEDIETLSKLGRQLIDPVSAFDLWLRKLFTDAQLTEALGGIGISEIDQVALKEATQVIPPINDLLLMAVREVFTPDIAAELGLFEDFPEDVVEWGEKQGLSRAWMEKYWAAHWVLPSPQMGFSMLHRGIIDENQLSILLRALDIVPAWRDKIIALSYNPLTRVDVRRMHALGVLSVEDVDKAYRDVGYSPANAARLTDFTVEFNKPASERDEPELKQLTRSNILAFYRNKILDREQATQFLVDLNYSPASAALFIDDVDYKTELKARRDIVANIAAQYDNNIIDYSTAEDMLYKSGLTPDEVTTALNDLLIVAANKIAIPSKTDLMTFLKAGFVTKAVFEASMGRLGYRQPWIGFYFKSATGAKGNA